MKYAIFFAGSGQTVSDEEYVYKDWADRLRSVGYETLLLNGVGVSGDSKWQAFKNTVGLKSVTGGGWAKIVSHAMDWLEDRAQGGNPEKIVVVGMSRGGVEAVICANCLNTRFPNTKSVFVFAIDPVQGFHATNDGSFDMRDNRNLGRKLGFTGSRDSLKARYSLTNEAPKTIPPNVEMYLSVLSQFRGSQRGVMWGFTPQSPTLNNMVNHSQHHKVYELPGDHASGVYSGHTNKGGAHEHQTSRQARSLVTRDMFFHWLMQKGFARVEQVFDFFVLDAYCMIANEDLGGVQFDGRNSGFSFLRASHNGSGRAFLNTAESRSLKGRGHLIASAQVAESQKLSADLHGYYVNERHFDLYRAVMERLRGELRKSHSGILSRCPNIVPWIRHNNREFRRLG